MTTETNGRWAFDKHINLSTGISLVQLVAVVWIGASFYTQMNDNQAKNEDRFATFAEYRKTQADQLLEMQKGQNQVLIQLSMLTERQNSMTDAIKEMRDEIKTGNRK